MAPASARPSKVEVPRPISSISTSDCSVAPCTIAAASVISSMKVDCALARSSAAPMRVWMASIGPSRQAVAGTKEPIAASSTISATWRMKVLLPPMFGPVMTSMRRVRVEPAVVGHEGAGAGLGQARLDHRVAAGLDVDAGLAHELRAGTSRAWRRARPARPARRAPASARASAVSGVEVRLQLVEQLLVEQLLARQRAVLRRQRLVLEGLQLGRDEALGVLQRLAALVVGRHLVDLALRDLDVEAVHLVELHAQVGDAGARALARLQVEQEGVAVLRRCRAARRASASKPGAITPPSRSSTAGSSAMAATQQRRRSRAAGAAPRHSMSSSSAAPCGTRARSAGSACSVARRPASSRGRTWRSAMRAVMRSTSLTPRSASRSGVEAGVRAAPRSRRAAAPATRALAQRVRQPVAQRAAAHAGAAGVEQRQQRGRVLAAQRLRQLEVAVRGRRQVEQVAGALAPSACARGRAPGPACARRRPAARRRRPAPARRSCALKPARLATRSCSHSLRAPSAASNCQAGRVRERRCATAASAARHVRRGRPAPRPASSRASQRRQLALAAFGQAQLAAASAPARPGRSSRRWRAHRQQQRVALVGQQFGVGHRAGRDDAHHLALDRALGGGHVAHLLGRSPPPRRA